MLLTYGDHSPLTYLVEFFTIVGIAVLLIPVVGLRPTVEFETANVWILLSNLRGPLLGTVYLFTSDRHHAWGILFGFAAFVQASLQNE